MTQTIEHPAVRFLRSFFAAMHEWESETGEYHEAIDWQNTTQEEFQRSGKIFRKKLEQIFEKYCEVGARAKRLQDAGLAFNLGQPEYDPKKELIVSVTEKGGKVIVETKRTYPPQWNVRYELVLIDGQWKVRDNRKRSSDQNPKWKLDRL